MTKRLHPETPIPYSSVLTNQYKRSHRTVLVAKSFIDSPSIVNESASQTVLPSTSGKDIESFKNTHPAPSQGDESKSEPDSKRKDVSIDPSPNQGGEADPKESPEKVLEE